MDSDHNNSFINNNNKDDINNNDNTNNNEEKLKNFPEIWFTEKHLNTTAMSFRVKSVLFSQKSKYQHICVLDTYALGKVLVNDGMIMLSERDEFIYHEMIAHVPIFAHPQPQNVLIIGGGDGGSAREVLKHKGIKKCTLVEIDEMVVEVCKKYIPEVATAFSSPRLSLKIEDGINFIKNSSEKFDIVLIDSTDPVGPAKPLFEEEFYKDIKSHLNKDGIVVSQAESPFYDVKIQQELLKVLKRVFNKVYIYIFHNITYPGGSWCFTFASDSLDPFKLVTKEKILNSNIKFKYYNYEIHKGAFCLPNFILSQVNDHITEYKIF